MRTVRNKPTYSERKANEGAALNHIVQPRRERNEMGDVPIPYLVHTIELLRRVVYGSSCSVSGLRAGERTILKEIRSNYSPE